MNKSTPAHFALFGQLSLEDMYIGQAFDYYTQRYQTCEWAQKFVEQSTRIPDEFRDHTYISLWDRTLGLNIPKRRSLDGGSIRGSLQHTGLFTPKGGELLRNCVVFADKDEYGNIVSATGYRYGARIRDWQATIIHWQKPEPDFYIEQGMSFVQEVMYEQT